MKFRINKLVYSDFALGIAFAHDNESKETCDWKYRLSFYVGFLIIYFFWMKE